MSFPAIRRSAPGMALAVSLLAVVRPVVAGEEWPRDVQHPRADIVVYQPQFDEYTGGGILKMRLAISVTPKGSPGTEENQEKQEKTEPAFGVIWTEAKANIDRDARMVTFTDIKVTRVRFPDATPEQQKALAAIIEEAAPQWDNDLDYDRFVVGVAALGKSRQATGSFRNDPPQIFVEMAPAMLLLYDGVPHALAIEGTKLKRIVNTPSVVINDPAAGAWYLYGGAGWFVAKEPMGPWEPAAKPSQPVAALVAEMEKKAAADTKARGEVPTKDDERVLAEEAKRENREFDPAKPPKVIPVTGPAEVIVFEGNPTWRPLVGAEILYADNTGGDVLMEVATQHKYLLLSGRWYRSKVFEGPWEFVPADALPAAFVEIPEDSDKGLLLAHVAGTPQAEEALADAQVPQVAAVKRSGARLEVTYDGAPQWAEIEGTSIEYAKNSAVKVLRIAGKYYACEQGIWYVADAATGPWKVADSVPEEIQEIPPDSPVYNLKYVNVYDATPEVVYVGYTPAYLGCYPYYGTVVWGTGYWYAPWIGSIYYPSPWTYGFHANYNPWTGWSFGFSIGFVYGWGSVTIGWSNWGWGGYYPPYWGPGGYYPIYRPPYYPGGYPPHYPGRYPDHHGGGSPSTLPSQPGGAGGPSTLPSQPGGGGRPSTLPAEGGRAPNLYGRPENRDRVASTKERAAPSTLPTSPGGGGRNNVFADDAGNVYRRNDNGSWDKRQGNSWQPAGGGARPGAQPSGPGGASRPGSPSARPGGGAWGSPSSGLQRDYSSRQRGASRAGGYSAGRGYGGGMRGGGGGRRG